MWKCMKNTQYTYCGLIIEIYPDNWWPDNRGPTVLMLIISSPRLGQHSESMADEC